MTEVRITEREMQSFERKLVAWLETLDDPERAIFDLVATRAMNAASDDVEGFGPKVFEVTDFGFDIEQTLNVGSQSSGAGAGKVTFNPFTITRKADSSSPTLFRQVLSG